MYEYSMVKSCLYLNLLRHMHAGFCWFRSTLTFTKALYPEEKSHCQDQRPFSTKD